MKVMLTPQGKFQIGQTLSAAWQFMKQHSKPLLKIMLVPMVFSFFLSLADIWIKEGDLDDFSLMVNLALLGGLGLVLTVSIVWIYVELSDYVLSPGPRRLIPSWHRAHTRVLPFAGLFVGLAGALQAGFEFMGHFPPLLLILGVGGFFFLFCRWALVPVVVVSGQANPFRVSWRLSKPHRFRLVRLGLSVALMVWGYARFHTRSLEWIQTLACSQTVSNLLIGVSTCGAVVAEYCFRALFIVSIALIYQEIRGQQHA